MQTSHTQASQTALPCSSSSRHQPQQAAACQACACDCHQPCASWQTSRQKQAKLPTWREIASRSDFSLSPRLCWCCPPRQSSSKPRHGRHSSSSTGPSTSPNSSPSTRHHNSTAGQHSATARQQNATNSIFRRGRGPGTARCCKSARIF